MQFIILVLFVLFSSILSFGIGIWLALNAHHKRQLKKVIELEGYFERFNDMDRRLRNNKGITIDEYVSGTRILYPWEFPPAPPIIKCRIMIFDANHEGGFPHTHGRYVLTPSLSQLSPTTFRHEQVHIYQRYNPEKVNQGNAHEIIGIVKPSDNCRANPDTNSLKYAGISAEYKPNAKKMTDLEDPRDHPFEVMAYALQT